MTGSELSRKSFLRAGGSLVIGLSLTGLATRGAAAANNPKAISASHTGAVAGPPDPTQIDSWLQVNADNTVTLFQGWTELGQGTPTAVRMIAAEELGLTMAQVNAVQVDTNVSLSAFTVGSTSTSTAMGATSMRGAAAAARTLLLNLSSAQLGVPVGSLSVSEGVVSGGGKSLKYSDLAAGKPFNSTLAAAKATLTSPNAYKVIGTRVPRIDIPDIVSGRLTYIQNVRVPGMLHGRVVRPRGQASLTQGATVISLDKSSVAHIPGVQVIQKGNFVGVVAPHEWDAIQAAAQLKVTWDETPRLPGSGNLQAALRDPAKLQSTSVPVNTGDVGAALASAAKTVSATYFTAYQMHGALGPNCSVASVTPGGALILCASQGPYLQTRASVSAALGLPASAVRVMVYPASGTYGHSTYDDVSISAGLLSQAVGKPVRVQFMRWDEHGWDQFGPAQTTDIRAGVDAAGNLVAYDYTAYNHGWTQVVESAAELAGTPLPAAPGGQVDTTASGSFYKLANRRVTSKVVNGYAGFLKGIWLRAPGAPQATFASEQTIDQLAHLAGIDPIAFRIQNIDASQVNGVGRWAAVLDAVSKASKWKPAVSASKVGSGNIVTGRGVAIGGFANSFPAIVADITLNRKTGVIAVDHLYAAQDAGATVNPASVENQMVGCLVHGTSRALLEEVRFSKARTTSLDWNTYPVLRFKDSPKVTTVVVQRLDLPSSGSGEPTTAAVPAAIANAFFDATGVRLYRMPMTPGYVRAALKA
ncbi:MAG TPA: molybdopterin cofactor-binding domain-containing protein [Gaiellaceae bacterium]